jgi:hypothetical protein
MPASSLMQRSTCPCVLRNVQVAMILELHF